MEEELSKKSKIELAQLDAALKSKEAEIKSQEDKKFSFFRIKFGIIGLGSSIIVFLIILAYKYIFG